MASGSRTAVTAVDDKVVPLGLTADRFRNGLLEMLVPL
jgi:hypothetical protein